jgi:ATP-dependent DNA helicase RecG
MIAIESITDLELLRESVDLECKLAAGRDGKGALPEDFWPTYSSFANTEGGIVVLGVSEKQGQFSIGGIANIAKVRKELFNGLNNRQKVSANLITDASVREVVLEGKTVGRSSRTASRAISGMVMRTVSFSATSADGGRIARRAKVA